MKSIWAYSGEGDSFRFSICEKCGSAVPTSSREAHEQWHKELWKVRAEKAL